MSTLAEKYKIIDDVEEQKRKIQTAFEDFNKENEIKLKESNIRNVLFVGRSRSGKSTAYGVLKNLTYVPDDLDIFMGTKEPEIKSFTVEISKDEEDYLKFLEQTKKGNAVVTEDIKPDDFGKYYINYNINIIDTPGLFEQREKEEEIIIL
jgi:predicted GTPase